MRTYTITNRSNGKLNVTNNLGKQIEMDESVFLQQFKKLDEAMYRDYPDDCDMDKVEYVVYTKDAGDDEYEDTYDLELIGGYGEKTLCFKSSLYFDEVTALLGEEIASEMAQNGSEREQKIVIGNYSKLYSTPIDLNDKNAVDEVAMKLFNICDAEQYAAWLLHNGKCIDASEGDCGIRQQDHNMCRLIPGVESVHQFIEMGNIRLMPESPGIELGDEPTAQQQRSLMYWMSNALRRKQGLYVDILRKDGTRDSYEYKNPNPRKLLNQIDRYFREGIRMDDDVEETEDWYV